MKKFVQFTKAMGLVALGLGSASVATARDLSGQSSGWRQDRMLTCRSFGDRGTIDGNAQMNVWWDPRSKLAWVVQISYNTRRVFSGSYNLQVKKVTHHRSARNTLIDFALDEGARVLSPSSGNQFKGIWHVADGSSGRRPSAIEIRREGGEFGSTFQMRIGRNLTDTNAGNDDVYQTFGNCSISNASVWNQLDDRVN